ncbi:MULTISPECIES: type II secretion system protein GspJ [Chromobacterium]|uniref:type II secretion system protein GspJ n=1 Tax=Chromobacterium TaxID=535 RepID=UPI0018888FF6|nr:MULTISPECIES: type II secretion system protein GspJ [Chromobacterium]QOZ82806.1 prepilin-type N-terminal cleavage/methylation domain-containing protein [Chromobacterium sp. Rain0013]WON82875.1 prepilin-type N-terminal cleavage/methylation domain-containing protein [Chromobacterium haemolyticum]
MRDGRQGGMTLIEILVAMSLLAILSVLGYKAFGSLLISRERLMQTSEQWVDAARAFRRLEGDLTGQMPAPTQGQGPSLGGSQLLLQSDGDGQTLTLQSFSARYPGGQERISYHAGAQGLSWAAGDAQGAAPTAYVLLAKDAAVRWRVMLDDGNWLENWPPREASSARSPRALEMRIRMPGNEWAKRIWALP